MQTSVKAIARDKSAVNRVQSGNQPLTRMIATHDTNTITLTAERTGMIQSVENGSQPANRQPVDLMAVEAREKETVLVVDDEELVRLVIVHMLRQYGYRVFEATGALEAQRLAETNEKIHLLVTDFSMPEINGLELAHWFQAKYPETKVLIATGSLWEFVNQVGGQEPFAVLAKPFDGIELGRMVRLVLDERPAGQPSVRSV